MVGARLPGARVAPVGSPTVQQVVDRPSLGARLGGYVALTKPQIIELLLVTTVPTMVVAYRGVPPVVLIAWTLVGGTLAAGGANAINMYVDRDIDAVMQRTKRRPLVTGVLQPAAALRFAIGLEIVAFLVLWNRVNLLSAVLAVSATLFYVFVYTMWLKRTSTQNIVVGGAAGAVPVLVGWTAVRDSLAWPPLILFAVIFFWTPPHFWALAVKYRDDYASVNVPMLPAVRSLRITAQNILGYTLFLWGLTLVFGPVAHMGPIYIVAASVLGGVFTWYALRLLRSESPADAVRVFMWSITYLTLLFAAIAVDQLVRSGI